MINVFLVNDKWFLFCVPVYRTYLRLFFLTIISGKDTRLFFLWTGFYIIPTYTYIIRVYCILYWVEGMSEMNSLMSARSFYVFENIYFFQRLTIKTCSNKFKGKILISTWTFIYNTQSQAIYYIQCTYY